MAAMAVAEEIGALNWEETSSLTGHNVDLAFSLCGLAVSRRKPGRVKRPSSLLLKTRAPPLYEDPDKASVGRQQGSDTDSLFSPQSRASLVLEPRHSVMSPEVPLRPHSSQSAMIRPSRLYRHSTHRLSSQGRLKPVSIPLSPNCDKFSDTSSILSPTGSTVSSFLSHPLHPPFRNSRVLALPSPSSSSSNSTFLPFSPVSRSSTDSRDSVNLPDTVTKRGSSLGCGWNLVFQPRIDEGEEESLTMVKREKQGRRGRTKTNKRDRCTLM